ncbi:multiple C2 and transmembrane domain-containing protein-like isoform X2 [Leguminivora glycinivorella]|uniref:multiple C2 and transmembrane domain-containing protein-like isoform X2 n=1 Tax=Leguminivora glycinivorella TaxID=1035111 RepID=UPI00200E1FA2|nr:multiple C2 and transmembrane domain-containing protein-like isoform X2 [Leguminivora glycinivorella]
MDTYKKNEPTSPTSTLTKRHFASIHSKIQNKYEEMQKRLEKSKSVDSLTGLNESFVFVQAHTFEENSEYERDGIKHEDKKPPDTFKVIVEEVSVNASSQQDVNGTYEVSYSEAFEETERKICNFFDGHYDNSLTASLESLNTLNAESTEYEESLPPPSPPVHKITIRDRIGSRIAAVKERRREKTKKKEAKEKMEKLILSNTTKQETKIVKKTKVGTVTIALIEATGFERDITEEKTRMLFCRFRLGSEKYKSKPIKSQSSSVKWQELFNINLFDENMLEISLWDKEIFLGRSDIDLSETEREKTHKMRLDLKEGSNVQLFILLTISGVIPKNIALDMEEYERQRKRKMRKRAWFGLRDDYTDVGSLSVFVYGGKGLAATDSYCVLQLNNDRLQTPTEFKTNEPNWMKIFTFTVTDITSILEVTIFEEKKTEIVGMISVPLLKINNGEKKWYALKDSTQRERAKGTNPRILLEMKVTWNLPRAAIRVINPKEEVYLEPTEKLDRHIFARNLSRAKAVGEWIVDASKVVKVWMLPMLFLLPFIWYRPENYFLFRWRRYFEDDNRSITSDDKIEKTSATSIMQKINSLQEMVQSVQNTIGKLASYGESVKNLYNFTVPFLSFLSITIIMVISLVMFLVPVNYIFMLWGVHKFTRKILRPNRIPNNEILDLLSRVPDDETLLDCEELPLEEISEDVVN